MHCLHKYRTGDGDAFTNQREATKLHKALKRNMNVPKECSSFANERIHQLDFSPLNVLHRTSLCVSTHEQSRVYSLLPTVNVDCTIPTDQVVPHKRSSGDAFSLIQLGNGVKPTMNSHTVLLTKQHPSGLNSELTLNKESYQKTQPGESLNKEPY